ncbi:hypothetical protein TB2_011840 [Malus domestica]
MHTSQTIAPRFSSLEDHVAALEATMASLPSLIDVAIEKVFATKLPAYFDKFRREFHFQSAGEGIAFLPLIIMFLLQLSLSSYLEAQSVLEEPNHNLFWGQSKLYSCSHLHRCCEH